MRNYPIINLVDQILAAKQQPHSSPFVKGEDPSADTSDLEDQIDEMVYTLYDLTPEEIAIVEGKGWKFCYTISNTQEVI